jgi:hypothetical protein
VDFEMSNFWRSDRRASQRWKNWTGERWSVKRVRLGRSEEHEVSSDVLLNREDQRTASVESKCHRATSRALSLKFSLIQHRDESNQCHAGNKTSRTSLGSSELLN